MNLLYLGCRACSRCTAPLPLVSPLLSRSAGRSSYCTSTLPPRSPTTIPLNTSHPLLRRYPTTPSLVSRIRAYCTSTHESKSNIPPSSSTPQPTPTSTGTPNTPPSPNPPLTPPESASIVIEKSLVDKTYKKVYFLNEAATQLADKPKSNVGQSKILLFLRDCFLPEGYPQSVAKDYTKYQMWQFVQNVVGSTAYVLATHACLTSVGVGTQTATPVAATVSWILRDGLGTIGLVLYAGKFARNLDADIKRSKFLGDIMHNIGVGIEILTPLFPGKFLLMASFANLLKSIAGLTLGATKASFNKMFSLQENMADVTAKYQSQGLVAYLVGMGIGLGLAQTIPNVYGHFTAFILLASTHLWASVQGLNKVTLNVLNEQRLNIVLEEYFRSNSIVTPGKAKQFERLVLTKYNTELPAIILGVSIKDAFSDNSQLAAALKSYRNENYLVTHHRDQFRVVLREGISQLGLMRAYFHAYYLKALLFTVPIPMFHVFFRESADKEWLERVQAWRKPTHSAPEEKPLPEGWGEKSLEFTNKNFSSFLSRVECAGWTTTNIPLPEKDMRASWKQDRTL